MATPTSKAINSTLGIDLTKAKDMPQDRYMSEDISLAEQLEVVYQRLQTDEERAEFLEIIQRRFQFQPIREFIPEVSPHLPPPEHTRVITDQVERAMRKPIIVLISFPPRHAKTVTILHCFAWWLRHNPADTCGYFTYSDVKGRQKSRIARKFATLAGIELAKDSQDVSAWRNTVGGGLLAGGRGGGLTGDGVTGLMVIDDPFKNRKEADSPTIREDVWEWFTEVVTTRLEGASLIVIHTRWHDDDLIGRLKTMCDEHPELSDIEVINLPAIAEDDDPLGRAPGEALWPYKETLAELERKRLIMGEWSFAALFQGRPRPRGANLFGEPQFYDPDKFDIAGCNIVIGADPAASTKTIADYSAAVVMAVRIEEKVIQMASWDEPRRLRLPVGYVLHAYRGQVTVPQFVKVLRSLQQRYYNAKIGVEAVAGFKAVPQMLLAEDPDLRVQEMPTVGDKWQRAQPAASWWNSGCLLLPAYADGRCPSWVKPYIKELCNFTGVADATDDQVDGTAHAVNQIVYAPQAVQRGSVAVPSAY